MELRFVPRFRTEGAIISCRIALAAFTFSAVTLNAGQFPEHALPVRPLHGGYMAYSVLLWAWIRFAPLQAGNIGRISHGIDLAFFILAAFLSEWALSPFLAYGIFSIFCGLIRWREQGALWTALAWLIAFLGGSIISLWPQAHAEAGSAPIMFRTAQLGSIGLLLVYLAVFERKRHNDAARLAGWPSKIDSTGSFEGLLRNLLEHFSAEMQAPRMLLIWETPKAAQRHYLHYRDGQIHYLRLDPDFHAPLVASELENHHFLCENTTLPVTFGLSLNDAGMCRRTLLPLHPELTRSYAVRSVIGLNLQGRQMQGWLFAFDKQRPVLDDLWLGATVADQMTALLDRHLAYDVHERQAAADVRTKIACDLHDTLLQTLTGFGLQFETLHRLLERDTVAAGKKLAQIQKQIVDEQRNLRIYIGKMQHSADAPLDTHADHENRLQNLAEWIRQQWGLQVILNLPPARDLANLPEDIHNLLRESLVNSARHAGAERVHAMLRIEEGNAWIKVSDDGRGFPFHGSYDLPGLTALGMGPKSLMERIKAMRGRLQIDSNAYGASLTISVPLAAATAFSAFTESNRHTPLQNIEP